MKQLTFLQQSVASVEEEKVWFSLEVYQMGLTLKAAPNFFSYVDDLNSFVRAYF